MVNGGWDNVPTFALFFIEGFPQLTDWLDSVDAKYPISSTTMVKNIVISFIIYICLGIGSVAFDMGTDWVFTDNMKSLYKEAIGNQTVVNCMEIFQPRMTEINTFCHDTSDPTECWTNMESAAAFLKNCTNREVNRFTKAENWNVMFQISRSHMIITWVMCAIGGLILAGNTKQWHRIFQLMPVVSKVILFYLDQKLNRLKTKPKSAENDDAIKDLEERKKEYEERVTFALLLEANSESSFQFVFQTVFSLSTLVLSVSGYAAAQDRSIDNLFNLRNLSILASFLTMAMSFYSIRDDSCTFIE